MGKEIAYSTIPEQIEKLKSQGLIISDEEFAINCLRCFGYSNLIKSYREPYMIITPDGEKKYRTGVTFEQIASLHELDKSIRNAVMAAMQDLEEHIKEISADVIAASFGTNQNDYIKFKNYKNKHKRIENYQLGNILDKLRETSQTSKNPIHHYQSTYGTVPPWILFKSLYFGTIVNFIDLFKSNEQTEVMKKFLRFEELDITEEAARLLMMNILFISMEYRNNAAHGGRMYNFSPNNSLKASEIFKDGRSDYHPKFTHFIHLLELLKYQEPHVHLHDVLDEEVNRHCTLFPQDVTYLGQILKIDITPCNMVFVCANSIKYHLYPNCSGIKDPIPIELSEATENGFIPCKRCVK